MTERLGHDQALDLICHTGEVLSYQEAIEGYLVLRGLDHLRDSGRLQTGEDAPQSAAECEASQSGAESVSPALTPSNPSPDRQEEQDNG